LQLFLNISDEAAKNLAKSQKSCYRIGFIDAKFFKTQGQAMSTFNDQRAADKTARTSFINASLAKAHPHNKTKLHSPHEISLMTHIEQTLSTSKDREESLDDSPFFPKWVSIKDGVMIGTCTGVVQTSPEDLLAYMYLIDTHQNRNNHIAANGPDSSKYPYKTIRKMNDHHKIVYTCRRLPPPLKPRDWLNRIIFHQPNADTIKYFGTFIHDDDPDLPPSFTKTTIKNIIRGEISMIHEYERLPHNQTRFTLRMKVDIKGSIPKQIANLGMSGALEIIHKAYKYFQRDEEIDELEVSLIEK